MENNYVPKDYEDLYQTYFTPGKLASKLCRSMLYGKQKENAEDAMQEAYLRLLKTDILTKFDPSKSNFGGAVFFACRSACFNMDRRGMKEQRDVSLVETQDEWESGTTSGDLLRINEGHEAGIIAMMEVEHLRILARASKNDGKAKRFQNQEQLLDLLLEGYTTEEIAGVLGISRTSVDLWVAALAEGVER